MSDEYYSTVDDVLEDSGIKPADLGMTTDDELETKIEKWLSAAKGYIDSDRHRDFNDLPSVPVCIADIAKRIVLNMVKQAIINRDTPIINADNYRVMIANDKIITNAIATDLDKCSKRVLSETGAGFGIWVVKGETDKQKDERETYEDALEDLRV